MTAVLICVGVAAGIAAVAVLIGKSTRLGDRRAGITDEQQDADQRAWIDRQRRRRKK